MSDKAEDAEEPLLYADNSEGQAHELVPPARLTGAHQHYIPDHPWRTSDQQPLHEYRGNRARPEDFTVAAVFTSIFCFTPVGLLAIYSAMQSTTMANIGQHKEAERHYRLAQRLTLASLIIGIGLIVVYTVAIGLTVRFIGDVKAH
ncbi:hypothetical protein DPMN_105796 [Dreissena polymorpha]|uniref:Uncharacterized protein n=1 Tax=Dreissena polymorpha TaxID=45954 RepID=A0A9D4K3T8_DREPO|nr:hypothetical protein DPMN_105796 [Dreissena polymorpha]